MDPAARTSPVANRSERARVFTDCPRVAAGGALEVQASAAARLHGVLLQVSRGDAPGRPGRLRTAHTSRAFGRAVNVCDAAAVRVDDAVAGHHAPSLLPRYQPVLPLPGVPFCAFPGIELPGTILSSY